jgi:hypothetical protein
MRKIQNSVRDIHDDEDDPPIELTRSQKKKQISLKQRAKDSSNTSNPAVQ